MNALLRNANVEEVCAAIQAWQIDEGFRPVSERRLFNSMSLDDEVRVFILWNENWCVILPHYDIEEGSALQRALNRFPVVLQLWAGDGAWGYRLEETGVETTSFCSKRRPDSPDDPPARRPGDLARLTTVCGIPEALPRLKRIEASRAFLNDKPCHNFAAALDAQVAGLRFYDLDIANAGVTADRIIAGWKCRMLCFVRDRVPEQRLESAELHSAIGEEGHREVERIRKKVKWLEVLVFPFRVVFGLLILPLIGLLVTAGLLSRIRIIRKAFLGRNALFCDDFITRLRELEPQLVTMHGDCAHNLRHGCTVRVPPTARVITDPIQKGPAFRDPLVFLIEVSEDVMLSCTAYPPARVPKRGGVKILDTRAFVGDHCEFAFEKRRTIRTNPPWIECEWMTHTSRASYSFQITWEKEPSAENVKKTEEVVRSFQPGTSSDITLRDQRFETE